jgi:predicted transport protein
VIFVSPQFSKYQKKAIEFKDLAMELWEARKYDNGTVLYNQIVAPDASESIKSITKRSPVIQKVGREIKVYSEDDHKSRGTHKTLQLYEHLRAMIFALGNDVSIKPTKFWISFKRRSNFADVVIWKSKLTVYLNASWGELKDPKTVARNVTKLGHWGMGSYEITVATSAGLYDAMGLIRQSYERQ